MKDSCFTVVIFLKFSHLVLPIGSYFTDDCLACKLLDVLYKNPKTLFLDDTFSFHSADLSVFLVMTDLTSFLNMT